jgi:hypothetical protein
MVESFQALFERLSGLTSAELVRSAEKLVRAEKRNAALLIAHIAEVSERNVALERGYKNTFDYCRRRLNLSEGAVALRLHVANVSKRVPQLLAAIAENRVSLTVAGLLAPHLPLLEADEVDRVLADCQGMSKRADEEYVVQFRTKPVFKPSLRKQPAQTPQGTETSPSVEDPPGPLNKDATPQQRSPSAMDPPPPSPPRRDTPNILQPAEPNRFNFRFSADRKFKEKFDRLAEVLGVENSHVRMAEVFDKAMEVALDKKDLKRKRERRLKRERKGASKKDGDVTSRPGHPGALPSRGSHRIRTCTTSASGSSVYGFAAQR